MTRSISPIPLVPVTHEPTDLAARLRQIVHRTWRRWTVRFRRRSATIDLSTRIPIPESVADGPSPTVERTLRLGGAVATVPVPSPATPETGPIGETAPAPSSPPSTSSWQDCPDHPFHTTESIARDAEAIASRLAEAGRRGVVPPPADPEGISRIAPVHRLPADPPLLRRASRVYGNAASAARLVAAVVARDYPGQRKFALEQAAVAQSQLLHLLETHAAGASCPVQRSLFELVRTAARDCGVHLDRGMRRNRLEDHEAWQTLERRLGLALEGRTPADDERRRLENRLAHDLDRLLDDRGLDEPARVLDRIEATAAALGRHGLAPDSAELGGLADLALHPAFAPETHPTLATIAGCTAAPRPTPSTVNDDDDDDAAAIPAARRLLEGRRIAIVCGEPRPDHARRIEDAFGTEVEWLDHRKGASWRTIADRAIRADLVVIASGFTSHEVAERLPRRCSAHGIPVVRLWRGYSPGRIAIAVLEQASRDLASTAA